MKLGWLAISYALQEIQANCIKLGQTHVRLPESGRGVVGTLLWA